MDQKLNVLLADDDDGFALLINRIMKSDDLVERCVLYRVSDGTEAVEYVMGHGEFSDRARFPMPDAIVLDQRMNKMDGSEALAEIKKNETTKCIPICIMSTSAEKRLQDLCYSSAAAFCIQKPLDFGHLERKIMLMVDFFTDVLELPNPSTDR